MRALTVPSPCWVVSSNANCLSVSFSTSPHVKHTHYNVYIRELQENNTKRRGEEEREFIMGAVAEEMKEVGLEPYKFTSYIY